MLSFRQGRWSTVATAARRTISLVATLGFAALLAPPVMADGVFSEVHAIDLRVGSAQWDSVNQYSFDLPLFDPAGGTRTLIGYEVNFGIGTTYTYEVAGNPTAHVVGCETSWVMTWAGELNGELWFPLDQPSGNVNFGQGRGVIRAPFSPAEPPLQDTGLELFIVRAFDEPALLAKVTGVGTVPVDCTHTLSALSVFEPRRWPGDPGVFVPDLLTITMQELLANVTVTYFWTPEPNSLALMGLGIFPLLRRRR